MYPLFSKMLLIWRFEQFFFHFHEIEYSDVRRPLPAESKPVPIMPNTTDLYMALANRW